ncbi:hypothetical protein EVA_19948 [gut metagenome]|uniref:Uncharacterized protein n=1 Tax=gut metagenome TaxID=749906 RepID=J9FX54_9ZZZZ
MEEVKKRAKVSPSCFFFRIFVPINHKYNPDGRLSREKSDWIGGE